MCFTYRVDAIQGYYYHEASKTIRFDVNIGSTGSVKEKIQEAYPAADFMDDLRFFEKDDAMTFQAAGDTIVSGDSIAELSTENVRRVSETFLIS